MMQVVNVFADRFHGALLLDQQIDRVIAAGPRLAWCVGEPWVAVCDYLEVRGWFYEFVQVKRGPVPC